MTARIATDPRSGAAQPAPLPVAAELEAIFRPLPRPASQSSEADAGPPREPSPRRGAGLGIAVLIALALIIAIAGIAGLAMRARTPLPQPRSQSARPTPVLLPSVSRQAPPQTAAPASVTPSAIEERHTIPEPQARATANPDGERTPGPRSHRRRATRQLGGRCRAGATSAWCLHGAVVAADDRLRGAYATAIRAGVDRRTLEDVRSDWSRLRRRANKDPQALIRGYGLLTQELRAEAGRAVRR